MTRAFLLFILSVLFFGCATIHRKEFKQTIARDTSTFMAVNHRAVLVEKVDTTVYTHADTTTAIHSAPAGVELVDSLSTSTQKISVVIANGTLHMQAIAKSQPVSITIDKKETTADKTTTAAQGSLKQTTKAIVKTVTRPAWGLWIGIVALLLTAGAAYYYFTKIKHLT